MDSKEFENLTADELKKYIKKHNEKDYLLVDVRQPHEYTNGHIPGAKLMLVMQLESRLYDLPGDKDMIFYCHSGGRSLATAFLVAEGEVTSGKIYNLAGGIMAWEDRTLPDMPRVQVFDKSKSLSELLLTAMELEKGAYLYYNYVFERFQSEPFAKTVERLSKAETEHAKSVYRFWKKNENNPRNFEDMFESLGGELLEAVKTLGIYSADWKYLKAVYV
ncbi:MAG: sulfurtransferase [Desulfobacteraceae bacterium]|nr:sulfurtransferase [Desulfobacteraceae bacterium]